jgi:hypothetical protein
MGLSQGRMEVGDRLSANIHRPLNDVYPLLLSSLWTGFRGFFPPAPLWCTVFDRKPLEVTATEHSTNEQETLCQTALMYH